MCTAAVSSDSSRSMPGSTEPPLARARSGTGGGYRTMGSQLIELPPFQAALTQVAGKGFAFVNGRIRVADDGRERVGNVAGGVAFPAKAPGEADLIDALAIELERPQPVGHQRAQLNLAAGRGDDYPIQVGHALLAR